MSMRRFFVRSGFAAVSWAAASAHAATSPEPTSRPFDLALVSWEQSIGCGDAITDGCGAPVAPAPSFGGCCWERTKLTGDWCGCRNDLAASGVTLDADNTSYYFGNTSGGLNRTFDYGGHADYVLNADTGKLGLMEGQFWKICAEHRWGQSISNDTGAFLGATVLPDLPINDSEDVYLTNVLVTQFLSEELASSPASWTRSTATRPRSPAAAARRSSPTSPWSPTPSPSAKLRIPPSAPASRSFTRCSPSLRYR
jgi:hypothetical protein